MKHTHRRWFSIYYKMALGCNSNAKWRIFTAVGYLTRRKFKELKEEHSSEGIESKTRGLRPFAAYVSAPIESLCNAVQTSLYLRSTVTI